MVSARQFSLGLSCSFGQMVAETGIIFTVDGGFPVPQLGFCMNASRCSSSCSACSQQGGWVRRQNVPGGPGRSLLNALCDPTSEAHSGTSTMSQVQLVFRGRDIERTLTGVVSASHREKRARGVGHLVASLENIFRCSDLHGVGPGEGMEIVRVKTGE